MSVLLNTAERRSVTVAKDAKVIDVVRAMVDARVGAAAVLDQGRVAGIFTERDVMRVVLQKLDAAAIPISEVMTSTVIPIHKGAKPQEAIRLMIKHHIRHLPVVDADGKFLAMLSIRHLLHDAVDILRSEAEGLENYAGYDGATG